MSIAELLQAFIGVSQCLLIVWGLWHMQAASAERNRRMDVQEKRLDRQRAEMLAAMDNQHKEAMQALERQGQALEAVIGGLQTVIERTAARPNGTAGTPSLPGSPRTASPPWTWALTGFAHCGSVGAPDEPRKQLLIRRDRPLGGEVGGTLLKHRARGRLVKGAGHGFCQCDLVAHGHKRTELSALKDL